jgi:YNFM family putative membrane transporter
MAYLAEEIDPRGLGLAMGLYVSGTALGGMLGRIVTGVVTDLGSWRLAMGAIGAIGLLAAQGFVLLLPPSRNFHRRRSLDPLFHLAAWRGHLRQPGLALLFLTGFLVMGTFVTVFNYIGFRLLAPPYNLGQSAVGMIFVIYLFGAVASSTAGALADRLGRGPVLIVSLLLSLTGIGLSLLSDLPWVIAGIGGVTIGFFASHAVASGWVGRLAHEAKGHAASLYLLGYYLGSSIMGSLGGWFWWHGGWPAVATFTAVMILAALAVAVALDRLARRAARI